MLRVRFPLCLPLLLLAVARVSAAPLALDGNEELSRRKIEATLSLPDRPSSLSMEDWEDWVDDAALSITDLYGEIGYLDAAVKIERAGDDSSKVKPEDDRIRIRIREGVRYKFGTVVVLSVDHAPPVVDADHLRSRPGKPFEKDLVFRDRRAILNGYGDAGYLHAKSTESLSPDTAAKTVNLEFLVDAGTQVIFDSLAIRIGREGDTTGTKQGVTSRRLLRSLLGLKPGDTVSLSTIATFERKLRSTRAFNYVRLRDSLLDSRGTRSAMILTAEERIPGEADASLFYETQYGAGVGLNWDHGNMLGNLHEGRLGGSLAQRKQSAYLGYASPLFFGTSLRFDNDLVANWYQDSRLQRSAGIYEGDFDITNSSKISRAFTNWSRGVSATELTGISERKDTNDVERSFNLNFINSAFFSFLDDAINPARGVRWSLTWGNGGTFLNRSGQLNVPVSDRHNWLELESAYYFPLSERLKLAFRLDGGRFFGAGGQNSERFFLGGPRSVRSYGWRELCPEKDPGTGVCLTDGVEPEYYLTSFEIRSNPFTADFVNPDGRWKFLLGLQVVPFIDYGAVWRVGESPGQDPSGRGQAFGLGLRYSLLSIFNVRLDYAADGFDREHEEWILDLAQAF